MKPNFPFERGVCSLDGPVMSSTRPKSGSVGTFIKECFLFSASSLFPLLFNIWVKLILWIKMCAEESTYWPSVDQYVIFVFHWIFTPYFRLAPLSILKWSALIPEDLAFSLDLISSSHSVKSLSYHPRGFQGIYFSLRQHNIVDDIFVVKKLFFHCSPNLNFPSVHLLSSFLSALKNTFAVTIAWARYKS